MNFLRFWSKTYQFTHKKTEVMSPTQRLAMAGLFALNIYFLVAYILWWFQPQHIPNNFTGTILRYFDPLIFALLSFVVFTGAIQRVGSWFALWHMKRPIPLSVQPGLKVAFLTCYVPGKEPVDMLEKTLRAMKAVRYPHDTWVLDEGNDIEVKRLCQRLGVKHFSRKGIAKYNQSEGLYRTKTKAGNHNSWRDMYDHNYDIVAQIDMDHVPHEDYFEKTLGYFRDAKVGFIGMPQIYKNMDNWIAKGSAEQAYFFHGPMQQGYYGADMPFLIGTSHIYRVKAMEQIGGYAPTIVEDHLTGMHFFANGWKGVFVPHILAEGEGPINWVDYFNQQMRWSYGLFEILFNHTPKLIGRLRWRQKINYFIAQLYYFTGVAVACGFILTILYLGFGIRAASMNVSEWLFHAIPPFILGVLVQIYAHKFTIDPKKEPIFGFVGMFLNLGANIIYALAFYNFLVGKKLKYMVTQKGTSAEQQHVPLSTFKLHILITFAMLSALAASFIKGNTAVQLQFWAIFNALTLFAVAGSTSYIAFIEKLRFYKFAYAMTKITLSAITVISLLTLGTYVYSHRPAIAEALSSSSSESARLQAGKVIPPKEGAFLGVSIAEHNNTNAVRLLEQKTHKQFAVTGYYQAWGSKDNRFNRSYAENISRTGSIPMITWEPWKPVTGYDRSETTVDQKEFRLTHISNGVYDPYITQYARDVKAYGKPVMIRFAHEMNGNWYPWGSTFNTPEEYKAAWRHVHEIFNAEGVKNVTWVWSPNEIYYEERVPFADDIIAFYPGDDYVDWVGFSSFNWAGIYKNNHWKSPTEMFDASISKLSQLNKPIMITETASADDPGNRAAKAKWIRDLADYSRNRSEIKGIVWFNTQDNGINWAIDSTDASAVAFSESFGPYFQAYLESENLHIVQPTTPMDYFFAASL